MWMAERKQSGSPGRTSSDAAGLSETRRAAQQRGEAASRVEDKSARLVSSASEFNELSKQLNEDKSGGRGWFSWA